MDVPRVVRVADILPLTDNPAADEFYVEPYPRDTATLADEIAELRELAERLDDPFTPDEVTENRRRLPLSMFLQLRPPLVGSVYNLTRPQAVEALDDQCRPRDGTGKPDDRMIVTNRELARMFEADPPGHIHQAALNCLFTSRDVSPPRQARIFMALEVAIYSALAAAWHYKWASDRPNVSYRQRPVEYQPALTVLYDTKPDEKGEKDGDRRTNQVRSPGTPRHPAYPSGHSTFAAAASEACSYFFPDLRGEFDRLADNIGIARMIGGVHWRSDHVAGQRIGRAVARVLISQLLGDPVSQQGLPPAKPHENPAPTRQQVRESAYEVRRRDLERHGHDRPYQDLDPQPDPKQDVIPTPDETSAEQAKSAQQGAR